MEGGKKIFSTVGVWFSPNLDFVKKLLTHMKRILLAT